MINPTKVPIKIVTSNITIAPESLEYTSSSSSTAVVVVEFSTPFGS